MSIDQYVYIYTIYNNNEHSNRQVNYHTHMPINMSTTSAMSFETGTAICNDCIVLLFNK